ncbi:MAG: SDR family oxidoreductase [Eubacteriales bacterium]|nr:SDR family oxidoreductase [Eubacteriales bacterium]
MSEKKICVITGGSSGIGYAAAQQMGRKGYTLLLAARNPDKLNRAVASLKEEGIEAVSCPCDIGDKESVRELALRAKKMGEVMVVLHIAGMSPHMGDAEAIMRGNALGTVYVHRAFYPVIAQGGCLVDTSSMSAYLTPEFIMPKKAFALAQSDCEAFFRKMMARVSLLPPKSRAGAAYAISKYFVIQYVKMEAASFGKRGVRVLSVTPGNFETPMGELEKEEAQTYLKFNALPRPGQPEEIAALFAALSSPEMSYLTGTDILCDGGCIAGGASALGR